VAQGERVVKAGVPLGVRAQRVPRLARAAWRAGVMRPVLEGAEFMRKNSK
jgi:hypothetical protein